MKKKTSTSKELEKDRGFFCSELIAKLYKHANIMEDSDVSCTQFLPANFTSKRQDIPLVQEATLEQEQLIVCSDI